MAASRLRASRAIAGSLTSEDAMRGSILDVSGRDIPLALGGDSREVTAWQREARFLPRIVGALRPRQNGSGVVRLNEAAEADVTRPSPARMYDYYLGGKDNYLVDRRAAEKALSTVPCGRKVAWANRKFLVRAVRNLTRKGIDQFLDLGTGFPTSPNVHQVARSINPAASVAYVDNDPTVVVHDRALLAGSDGITAVRGDVRSPLNIITDHDVREVIDFNRPVGVLFVAVLHFVAEEENPYESVAAFRDCMRPGSYVVISHITSDGTAPNTIHAIQEAYRTASAPAVFRTREQIESLFSGFRLLRPGLVEVSEWRANGRKAATPPALRFLGGVGARH